MPTHRANSLKLLLQPAAVPPEARNQRGSGTRTCSGLRNVAPHAPSILRNAPVCCRLWLETARAASDACMQA